MENRVELVYVIDEEGILKKITAIALEGVGIFHNGEEYPAGFDKKGNIYASYAGCNNEVMTSEGEIVREGLTLDTTLQEYRKDIME